MHQGDHHMVRLFKNWFVWCIKQIIMWFDHWSSRVMGFGAIQERDCVWDPASSSRSWFLDFPILGVEHHHGFCMIPSSARPAWHSPFDICQVLVRGERKTDTETDTETQRKIRDLHQAAAAALLIALRLSFLFCFFFLLLDLPRIFVFLENVCGEMEILHWNIFWMMGGFCFSAPVFRVWSD